MNKEQEAMVKAAKEFVASSLNGMAKKSFVSIFRVRWYGQKASKAAYIIP